MDKCETGKGDIGGPIDRIKLAHISEELNPVYQGATLREFPVGDTWEKARRGKGKVVEVEASLAAL